MKLELTPTKVFGDLLRIRAERPLVHHLTNWVTIYDCAQITRSTGGLPVMAHAVEESGDMTKISKALVINIGTLTKEFIKASIEAGKRANEMNIPVILDAVGAGATPFRTLSAQNIIEEVNVSVLKGNGGEIATLAGAVAEVRGVESVNVEGDPKKHAEDLARELETTVAITGEVDIVTDGSRLARIMNGHELMGKVVGTGCMSASVIGTFAAVNDDPFNAAAGGLSAYGIAGEIAAKETTRPMEFKNRLMDTMSDLKEEDLASMKVILSN